MLNLTPLPRTLHAALRDARHSKPQVRASALSDLGKLAASDGAGPARAALIDALADASALVRGRALTALADAGVSLDSSLILPLLSDADSSVRELALLAVGELCDPTDAPARDAVRAALEAENPALRFQALIACARLEGAGALPKLTRAFVDPDARVRYVALRSAEEHLARLAGQRAESLYEAAQQILEDEAREVRLAAAILLAHTGDAAVKAVLVAAVNARAFTREPEDEQKAIELSGELGLREAYPGLVRRAFGGLWSRDRFAWQARVALARLGDPRARRSILKELGAWSFETRTLAVAAAGQARLAEARAPISAMRGDARKADPETVTEALGLLARGSPESPMKSSNA